MWPAQLQKLIQAHGVDAVWSKGLEVLGYPPIWALSGKEIAPILRAFTGPVPEERKSS